MSSTAQPQASNAGPSSSVSSHPPSQSSPLTQNGGPSGPKLAAAPQPARAEVAAPSSSSSSKKRKPDELPLVKERNSSVAPDPSTDDDAASQSGGGVRRDAKRTRVHFSCVECHRRKQKCDRKEPCSQCVARRVPHLCRPFLNGVEEANTSDVHMRLNAIEGLLSRLVSSLPSMIQASSGTTGVPALTAAPDVSTLMPSGEEIFHPSSAAPDTAVSTTGSGDMLPQRIAMPHKPPPSGLFPAGSNHSAPPGRPAFGWGLREGRLITLNAEDNQDLKEIIATLQESGISKNHLEWMIAGVPGRRMADGLVDLYFRDIDWTRYKMNRPSFMRRYNTFFDSIHRNPTNPHIDADTLKWLPLMFIVLAIATLSAPSDIVPAADQSAWSRRFYGSARSGLEYAKALQRDNLDVLFAGLLASRYMLLTRRPAEGSTPLTTAFQLGLYRDGTVLNLTDKREIEVRRRAWAMLYHLDRTISLLVGRPASISDAHTDTRLPANLDDDELEGDFDPAGHPLTKPTIYTYAIVRHGLAEIMGRIAYHTFSIQLPDYSTVINLDKELLAWRETLPPFLGVTNADTSLDADHPYLFVQRHLLAGEWYYARITLNRPYLLRRKPQDSRYAYSKDAAIESATADLLSRRAFVMEKGNLIVNSGGYRVLNSYMVLGVTIKLDPDSPQADKLRHLLNVVSGRAPDAQGRVSEPLVKEELAIVEFLTAKSSASGGPGGSSAGAGSSSRKSGASGSISNRGAETPVDLLLGLAKTRSGKRAAEEERRIQRLQTAREQDEVARSQAAALAGGSSNSSSGRADKNPWDYVAPQMPGLDVQQPFGDGRKGPRPLQPPSRSRPAHPMQQTPGQQQAQAQAQAQHQQQQQHLFQLQRRASLSINQQQQQQQGQQMQQMPQQPRQSPSGSATGSGVWGQPEMRFDVDLRNPFGQSSTDTNSFATQQQNMYAAMGLNGAQSQQPQHRSSPDTVFSASPHHQNRPSPQSQQPLISPYQSIGGLPSYSPSSQAGVTGAGTGSDMISPDMYSALGSNGVQFGNTAFSDIDLSDLGINFAMSGPSGTDSGFNPFALPQTEEGAGSGSEGMAPDDETQFLNYILTKFANSSAEAQ